MLERRPLRFAVIFDDEDASDTTSAISQETGAFLSVQIAKEEHLMKHLCKKIAVSLLTLTLLITMMPAAALALSLDLQESVDKEWYNFRNNQENNGYTDRATPQDAETTGLKWAQKYEESSGRVKTTPTPPLILDGALYVGLKNKVYKLDKETGEVLAKSEEMVSNVGYAMNPILYADGKLFVQVGNGVIQALDYKTLECVWSTEKIGGQTVSPISYTEVSGQGYIYMGVWNNSNKDGALLCVSTDDGGVNADKIKETTWRFIPSGISETLKNTVYTDTKLTFDADIQKAVSDGTAGARGFYWAGAYACENFIAIGSDDGANDYGDPAKSACFYTLDPESGEIIDKISGIEGDIRTTVVYDEGFLYFCTKGGQVYKVAVDYEGNLDEPVTLDLGGEITASPVVYNDRLYVGVRGEGGQFDPDAGHAFAVVDTQSMRKLYDLPIDGYPQASALLSTAYKDKDFDGDEQADGRVYIYFTYNAKPGGIYYTYDAAAQAGAATESGVLFTPPEDMQEYCTSTLCADRDGVLYYKNDSGYLMAVEQKEAYATNMEVEDALSWSSDFHPGLAEYEIVMKAGSESTTLTLTVPEGMSATVDGQPYKEGGVRIALDEDGRAEVKVAVTCDSETMTYALLIRCQSADSSLSELLASKANTYNGSLYELSPSFAAETTEYTVDVREEGRAFENIWPTTADSNASIKVYAVKNVSADRVQEDGTIKVTATNQGHDRYAVYHADGKEGTANTVVRVEVTSESGLKVTSYTVTFLRGEAAPEEPGDDSDEPATPEEPGDSDEPATPEEPGDSDEPATPEEPGDSDESGEPVTPEEPGDDSDEPAAGDNEPAASDEPGEDDEAAGDATVAVTGDSRGFNMWLALLIAAGCALVAMLRGEQIGKQKK